MNSPWNFREKNWRNNRQITSMINHNNNNNKTIIGSLNRLSFDLSDILIEIAGQLLDMKNVAYDFIYQIFFNPFWLEILLLRIWFLLFDVLLLWYNCKVKNLLSHFSICCILFTMLVKKPSIIMLPLSYKTHNVSDLHYFVMYFFFIHLPILVHAMDTTPIVKTIQNNGNFCYVFFFVVIKKISFVV